MSCARIALTAAQQVVDAIFAAVTEFRGDRPQSDDLTAVAVRITA